MAVVGKPRLYTFSGLAWKNSHTFWLGISVPVLSSKPGLGLVVDASPTLRGFEAEPSPSLGLKPELCHHTCDSANLSKLSEDIIRMLQFVYTHRRLSSERI